MATETEHKYLVDAQLWAGVLPHKSVQMKQGYLVNEPDKTIRVRLTGAQAYITMKGKTINNSRPEFEYEIPVQDAIEMLSLFCNHLVEKTRHYVLHEDNLWEVDIFEGLNAGLIIAEIELKTNDDNYKKPEWVNRNVSDDFRYSNASLSVSPFTSWTTK